MMSPVKVQRLVPFSLLFLSVLLCGCASSTETFDDVSNRESGAPWKVALFPVESKPSESEAARLVDSLLFAHITKDERFKIIPFDHIRTRFPGLRGMKLTPAQARAFKDEFDVDVILASEFEEFVMTDARRRLFANIPSSTWPTHRIKYIFTNTVSGQETHAHPDTYGFRMDTAGNVRNPTYGMYQTLTNNWRRKPDAPECTVPGDAQGEWSSAFGFFHSNHDGWQPSAAGEIGEVQSRADNSPYPYYVYEPKGFAKTGWSYPLIIYLHGTSARSDTLSPMMFYASPLDGIQNTISGAPAIPYVVNRLDPRLRNSLVLMPQLHRRGDPIWDPREINKVVAEVLKKYPIDSRRIYLTGISRGGAGAWAYGAAVYPKLAAIAPLAGSVIFRGPVRCYADTPIWTFHAFDDTNVQVWQVLAQLEYTLPGPLYYGDVNLLRDYPHSGGNPDRAADDDYTLSIKDDKPGVWKKGTQIPEGRLGLTIYRTGNHAIFSQTYAKTEFWDWMYAQKRD